MKYTYLYLFFAIIASACQSSIDTKALDRMLRTQDASKEQAIKIIEKSFATIEDSNLETILKTENRSGVDYDYTIYRSEGKPVKITYDIKAETYTVSASYYVHDSIPYYIHGTMRDQDRASGKYTHQELFTYLDGKNVIKQLRKTAVNQENRTSDLKDIPIVDITKHINQPELDASMKYEEVKNILKIQ